MTSIRFACAWLACVASAACVGCATTGSASGSHASSPAYAACIDAILATSKAYRADAPPAVTQAAIDRMIALGSARDAEPRCRASVAAAASVVARGSHRMWSDGPTATGFATAEQLYRVELATFPTAVDTARDEYYLADLLNAHADALPDGPARATAWDAAGDAFAIVVAHHAIDPALLAEASYAAVLARREAYEAGDPDARTTAIDVAGSDLPQPFAPRAARLLAAIHAYRATAAGRASPDTATMEFLEARVEIRYRHLDDAIALYLDIVDHARTTEIAPYAATLLLDLYVRTQRMQELAAFVHRIAADRAWLAATPDLAVVIDQLESKLSHQP